MKKRWKKGSVTIETALLIPIILLVLMGVIYLFFWVHNRAWLTSAAYESAVSGSMEGVKRNGNAYEEADRKGRELGSMGFFGTENLSVQTSTGKTVKVTYTMDILSEFGGFDWHLSTSGKAKILKPVVWIRRAKAASDTFQAMGDGT